MAEKERSTRSGKVDDRVISTADAARLTGRTPRWIQTLAKDGFITMTGRGQIEVGALMAGVIAYYEDQSQRSNKSAAANRATDARTREIELRIAERENKLLPIEDCEAVVSELAALVLQQLSGLPAQCTRDADLRAVIDVEVGRVLDKIRAHAIKQGAALRSGLVDLDAGEASEPGGMGGGE